MVISTDCGQLYFFSHIPRTGGKAFSAHLDAVFGADAVWPGSRSQQESGCLERRRGTQFAHRVPARSPSLLSEWACAAGGATSSRVWYGHEHPTHARTTCELSVPYAVHLMPAKIGWAEITNRSA